MATIYRLDQELRERLGQTNVGELLSQKRQDELDEISMDHLMGDLPEPENQVAEVEDIYA